jgi:hypothetical protein
MFSPFTSDCVFRTNDIQGPFSATYDYKPFPEPDPVENMMEKYVDDYGQPDPIMQEKQEIIAQRPVRGRGKGKKEPKKKAPRLPGQKLMKKLHKEAQMERSLGRVIKDLSDLDIKKIHALL